MPIYGLLGQDGDGGQLIYIIAIIILSLAGWLAEKFKQKMADSPSKSRPVSRSRPPQREADREAPRPGVPPVVRRESSPPTAREVPQRRPTRPMIPPPPGARPRPPARRPAPPPARPRPAFDQYETVYEAPKPPPARPVPPPRPRPQPAAGSPPQIEPQRARLLAAAEADRLRKEAEARLREQQASDLGTLGTITPAAPSAPSAKAAKPAATAAGPGQIGDFRKMNARQWRQAIVLNEILQPPIALRGTPGGQTEW